MFAQSQDLPNRRCCFTQLKGTIANPPLDELIEHEWNILGLLEHFLFVFVDKRCKIWIKDPLNMNVRALFGIR